MPTLFIASGPHEGRWFPIRSKSLVVGRDESLLAQVVDPGVSRKHLQISYDTESDRYFALDLRSRNGVLVNGQKVSEQTQLKDDDLITIGQTLLLFTMADIDNDQNALKFYRTRGMRDVPTITEKQRRETP